MDQQVFAQAVAFAARKHAGQTRRDGSPYIYHPLKVAELLKEGGFDLTCQVAAVLHDVLEDTDATEAEVAAFGEEVLTAVKLLTRLEGMDEECYVNRILKNPTATAVKAADKIHNVWEASYTADARWAGNYIKKAERHYRGRFSKALDSAIGTAEATLRGCKPQKKPLFYRPEEMTLYSTKARQRYEERKERYFCNNSHPDLLDPGMEFLYDRFLKSYYCFTDRSHVWTLGPAGWLPCQTHPYDESEYGEDLRKKTREEVAAAIEKYLESDYFDDFVDLSRVKLP